MTNIFFSSNGNIAMALLLILNVLLKMFNNVSILRKRENGKRLIIGRLILSGLILINFVYFTPYTFLSLAVLFMLDTLFSRFAENIFSLPIYTSLMIQIALVMRFIISEASRNSCHIWGEAMGLMLFSINIFLLFGLLLEVNERNKEKEKATIIERKGFPEDEGEDNGKAKQGKMSDGV